MEKSRAAFRATAPNSVCQETIVSPGTCLECMHADHAMVKRVKVATGTEPAQFTECCNLVVGSLCKRADQVVVGRLNVD